MLIHLRRHRLLRKRSSQQKKWNKIVKNAQPIYNIKVTHGTIERGPASAIMQFNNADIEESPMAQMLEDRFLRHCLNIEIKENALIDIMDYLIQEFGKPLLPFLAMKIL